MIDDPAKRQIRIKITRPETRQEKPVQEYVYRWDRIIGVLTASLVLLGALGYGLSVWLKPGGPPAGPEIEDPLRHAEKVAGEETRQEQAAKAATPLASGESLATDRAEKPVPAGSVGITGAPALDTSDAVRSPTEPPSGFSTEHSAMAAGQSIPPPPGRAPEFPAAAAAESGLERPAPPDGAKKATVSPTVGQAGGHAVTPKTPAPASSEPDSRRPEQEPLSGPVPDSSAAGASRKSRHEGTDVVPAPRPGGAAADAGVPEQRRADTLFGLPNTSISSPAVKRFLLAKDVVGNEPRGGIGDIAFNDAGYAEVSCFSEVIDQKGETLQYRWLHEGKEVLRIRVPVGANRWRSHSTKNIYAAMKGRWRAELLNAAGKVLASIDFTF